MASGESRPGPSEVLPLPEVVSRPHRLAAEPDNHRVCHSPHTPYSRPPVTYMQENRGDPGHAEYFLRELEEVTRGL